MHALSVIQGCLESAGVRQDAATWASAIIRTLEANGFEIRWRGTTWTQTGEEDRKSVV